MNLEIKNPVTEDDPFEINTKDTAEQLKGRIVSNPLGKSTTAFLGNTELYFDGIRKTLYDDVFCRVLKSNDESALEDLLAQNIESNPKRLKPNVIMLFELDGDSILCYYVQGCISKSITNGNHHWNNF